MKNFSGIVILEMGKKRKSDEKTRNFYFVCVQICMCMQYWVQQGILIPCGEGGLSQN